MKETRSRSKRQTKQGGHVERAGSRPAAPSPTIQPAMAPRADLGQDGQPTGPIDLLARSTDYEPARYTLEYIRLVKDYVDGCLTSCLEKHAPEIAPLVDCHFFLTRYATLAQAGRVTRFDNDHIGDTLTLAVRILHSVTQGQASQDGQPTGDDHQAGQSSARAATPQPTMGDVTGQARADGQPMPNTAPLFSGAIMDKSLAAVLFQTYARIVALSWRHHFKFTDWLTMPELERSLGRNRAIILRHIRQLESLKLIEWLPDVRNRYRFFIKQDHADMGQGGQPTGDDHQGGQSSAHPGGSARAHGAGTGQARKTPPRHQGRPRRSPKAQSKPRA